MPPAVRCMLLSPRYTPNKDKLPSCRTGVMQPVSPLLSCISLLLSAAARAEEQARRR